MLDSQSPVHQGLSLGGCGAGECCGAKRLGKLFEEQDERDKGYGTRRKRGGGGLNNDREACTS